MENNNNNCSCDDDSDTSDSSGDTTLEGKTRKFRNKDYVYVKEAINSALKSNMRTKHGCVIVNNGKIISKGFNRSLGSNKYQSRDFSQDKTVSQGRYSIHAEQDALRNSDPKKLDGAKLYVIRLGCGEKNPFFMNSYPCARCSYIIKKFSEKHGLKQVIYSTDDCLNSLNYLFNEN